MNQSNLNVQENSNSIAPITLCYEQGADVMIRVKDFLSWNSQIYSLDDYFHCDVDEKSIIQEYRKNGYFFVGSREYNEPYPDYMKEFLEHNPNLLSGEEKSFPRTPKVDFPEESFSELVFVKLRWVSWIDQQIQDFSFRIGELLIH